MIGALIRACVRNRFFVLLGSVLLAVWGAWAVYHTPVDALPDLSDTQVIIRTSYPGKAPQLVEDQITYPLTTAMLSVPGATSVRGYSSFGDSYVYVIFDDKTDLYWARSRVLEYLNQVQGRLPDGVTPALGPRASAGFMNTPWWTKAANTTWPSCALCRTGCLSLSWPPCPAWPRWLRWAAWSRNTRSLRTR